MKIIEYSIEKADYKLLIETIASEFSFNCSFSKNNISIYFKEKTIENFNFCISIIFDYTDENKLDVIIIYSGGKASIILKESIYWRNLKKTINNFFIDICKKNNWKIIEKSKLKE